MTSLYTLATKDILRADIRFIDEQLDFARKKMQAGDTAEAWSTLDSLLGYYDFKKHFPDIFVNENSTIRFMDMYEVFREIDNLIEVDAVAILGGDTPPPWRPQHQLDEIMTKLREFIRQLDQWKALNWFEGESIIDAFNLLKKKIENFIRFAQNFNNQPVWGPVIDVRDAKKILLSELSDDLPFWEVYEKLISMDRNLRFLVFRFRAIPQRVTKELVESVIGEIEELKHSIRAIVNATRADDEEVPVPIPEPNDEFPQHPPGWDDLQPFPPHGYAMVGPELIQRDDRLRRAGRELGSPPASDISTGYSAKHLILAAVGALSVAIAIVKFID